MGDKIKMPKTLDDELESYKRKIGRENFKNLYSRVYAKTLSNKRFSGRKYENSLDKLTAIKEKYKKRSFKKYYRGNAKMTKQTEDFIKLYHLRRADKIKHACENCTYCTGYEFKIGRVDIKCHNPLAKCISNKIDKTWVCDLFIERKSENENSKSKK